MKGGLASSVRPVHRPLASGRNASNRDPEYAFEIYQAGLPHPIHFCLFSVVDRSNQPFLWVASIIIWNLADFKRAKRFAVNVLTPRKFLNQLENPT